MIPEGARQVAHRVLDRRPGQAEDCLGGQAVVELGVDRRVPRDVGAGQVGPDAGDLAPAGGLLGEGEVLEADPPRRLVHTMTALWSDEVTQEGASRVTWEIEPVQDSCRLVVTHDQLREGANDQIYGGWPMILSGLKTWLETGELLTTPGSLMYAG